MARPQTEDGFLMLAHELFCALAYAGFTKWEWAVIREVLAQVYGPKRTRTATVSPSDLAGRLGTFKQAVNRATSSLVASGVLVKAGENEYRFVKDYESWKAGDKPRLSDPEKADCRSSRPKDTSIIVVNNGDYASTKGVNNGAYEASTTALTHKQEASTTALTNVSAGAYASVPPLCTPLYGEEEKKNPPTPKGVGDGGGPILRLAQERWGASNGESVVSDLLRVFPPSIVGPACDAHWDRVQQAIHPGRLRAICREMAAGRWEMPRADGPGDRRSTRDQPPAPQYALIVAPRDERRPPPRKAQ